MISYHPVKCGGHGYCGNGEIIVLKSRLILLVAGKVAIMPRLVVIGIVVVEISWFYFVI